MNHDVYNRNADNHADRTSVDTLPPEFFDLLDTFTARLDGGTVLDVGCGVGRDLRLIVDDATDVRGVGLDIAENMVAHAADATSPDAPIEYVQATATGLPFPDNSMDGIWCPATVFLLDFDQMKQAIREMRRVTAGDAPTMIGFKLQDAQSDANGYQTRERWGEDVTYYYVDEALAQDLCEDAGFTVVDTHSNSFDETVFYNLIMT